jgi:hypothetical protein
VAEALFAPQHQPLIVGDDDGSTPRLVVAQAYGFLGGVTWRKEQGLGWVVGTDVDSAIAAHVIAPVATADPPRVEPTPEPAPAPVEPVEVIAFTPADEPDEATYDLDADPEPVVKRGPGRPRKLTV